MEERARKKGRYDKRLIKEIVKQIEEGVPRKDLIKKYSLRPQTVLEWLNKYGSELYHKNKRKTYSNKDKHNIVTMALQGRMSVREACITYGIKSEKSVQDWISKFKKENLSFSSPIQLDMSKKKKAAEIKSGSDDLRKALEEAQLKIIALNTMIDVAEEQLKIDIRKKFGAKPSLD